MGLFSEFRQYAKTHKKFWVLPIVFLLLLAALIILAESSAIAPFIYTLF